MLSELVLPAVTAIAAGGMLYLLKISGITGGLLPSMVIKGTSSVLLVAIIVQLSGRYDILGLVKTKINTIKSRK